MSDKSSKFIGDAPQTAERIRARIEANPEAQRNFEERRALVWLGRAVRHAREQTGITQAEAAVRSGMTQSELSRLENGLQVKGVTFTTLLGLCNTLQFDIVLEKAGNTPRSAKGAAATTPLALSEVDPVPHLAYRE